MIGNSNEEINFPQKLFLINTQVSKIQLSKIGQSGGFLGRLLGPLSKTSFPLGF